MRNTSNTGLKRRHLRIRRKVKGTPDRPRLCIHKTQRHLYAQIVNDVEGATLLFATTNTKQNKAGEQKHFSNREWARRLGENLGRQAVDKGVTQVVFDRGGYRYHGVIREFADAARAAGLKF